MDAQDNALIVKLFYEISQDIIHSTFFPKLCLMCRYEPSKFQNYVLHAISVRVGKGTDSEEMRSCLEPEVLKIITQICHKANTKTLPVE